MSNTMKCPHCNYEHDLTNYLVDGYIEDEEHECWNCDKTFSFLIEFYPVVYVNGKRQ